jgi:hypothetical protein
MDLRLRNLADRVLGRCARRFLRRAKIREDLRDLFFEALPYDVVDALAAPRSDASAACRSPTRLIESSKIRRRGTFGFEAGTRPRH